MYKMSLNDAKMHLQDLINAAVEGKEVFITKDDKPMVQLISAQKTKRYPQWSMVNPLTPMADERDNDFDAPLDDFEDSTHSLAKRRKKTSRRSSLFCSSGGCFFGSCNT